MQTFILKQLKNVEIEHNVRVLYACEAGSRAWGLATKKSDFDVRFIYIHPLDWYLSITDKCDVIELPINSQLDMNGWELRKALRLLKKSNPSLLEWLSSPTVYLRDKPFFYELSHISEATFSPLTCCHHYLQMAKRNMQHILYEEYVQVKKYFYVLRPIFACKWIEEHSTFPPLLFRQLIAHLLDSGSLKQEINLLIYWRKSGVEQTLRTNFLLIDEFIHHELSRITKVVNKLKVAKTKQKQQSTDAVTALDALFRNTLGSIWGK